MRMSILSILLFLLSLNVMAQKKGNTLTHSDSLSWGAYGGPRISLINPVGKTAFMVGGHGAIVLNSQFALGGFGQGMTGGSSDFNGALYGHDNTLELSMGYGGIFLEYMPFRHKLLHPSFSLPIGLGGASVKEVNSDYKISKTTLMVFTPRVGFDVNLGKSAVVSLFAGYQFIKTNDNFMIAENNLSGWELGINLKLGKF